MNECIQNIICYLAQLLLAVNYEDSTFVRYFATTILSSLICALLHTLLLLTLWQCQSQAPMKEEGSANGLSYYIVLCLLSVCLLTCVLVTSVFVTSVFVTCVFVTSVFVICVFVTSVFVTCVFFTCVFVTNVFVTCAFVTSVFVTC